MRATLHLHLAHPSAGKSPARRIVALCVIASLVAAERAAAAHVRARPPKVIYLQPLGETGVLSRAELARLRRAVTMFFPVKLRRRRPMRLPAAACNSRGCRARALLDALQRHLPRGALRIIGVTREPIFDIYGKHSLGFAAGLGQPAVVTISQLPEISTQRIVLAKVVLHELGHAFGLDHCADPMCLMSMGAELSWMHDFCPACRSRLRRRGFPARRRVAPPWPPPKRVKADTRRLLRRLSKAGPEIIFMPDTELDVAR